MQVKLHDFGDKQGHVFNKKHQQITTVCIRFVKEKTQTADPKKEKTIELVGRCRKNDFCKR